MMGPRGRVVGRETAETEVSDRRQIILSICLSKSQSMLEESPRFLRSGVRAQTSLFQRGAGLAKFVAGVREDFARGGVVLDGRCLAGIPLQRALPEMRQGGVGAGTFQREDRLVASARRVELPLLLGKLAQLEEHSNLTHAIPNCGQARCSRLQFGLGRCGLPQLQPDTAEGEPSVALGHQSPVLDVERNRLFEQIARRGKLPCAKPLHRLSEEAISLLLRIRRRK